MYYNLGLQYLDIIHEQIEEKENQLVIKLKQLNTLKNKGYKDTLPYSNLKNYINELELDLSILYDSIDEIMINYFN